MFIECTFYNESILSVYFVICFVDNVGVIQDVNFNVSYNQSFKEKKFIPLQKSESAPMYQEDIKEKSIYIYANILYLNYFNLTILNSALFKKVNSYKFVNLFLDEEHERNVEVAGVLNWKNPHNRAYGSSTTLYELHPLTKINAGEPIADCFAVVARENSAILVLADGVNWGQKACIAARAAVHGCVDYLNKSMFSLAVRESFTTTVRKILNSLFTFRIFNCYYVCKVYLFYLKN